jgi:hypothetical protein
MWEREWMSGGGTYRVEVRGRLGDLASHSFPRMQIRYTNGNTLLVGPVRDQAELTGMLQRFSDLGISLLSVTALDESRAGS